MLFFFQAEDGIRDYKVTGVQTCALPILLSEQGERIRGHVDALYPLGRAALLGDGEVAAPVRRQTRERLRLRPQILERSEERRVGKERRAREPGAEGTKQQ